MQSRYKVYNAHSTTSYTNHMIVAGLIVGSSLSHSYEPSLNMSDFVLPQYSQVANQTNLQNKAVDIVKNSISQIKNANFDFLIVDEKIDREIDSYLATYSGTDKEILDI